MKKQRRSKEQWKLLVEDFKVSGLSLAAWCREKNISKSSIYPYIKTFDNNIKASEQNWGVVAIPKITAESSISLKIGSITLDIKSGFNKETLSDVLSVVTKLC